MSLNGIRIQTSEVMFIHEGCRSGTHMQTDVPGNNTDNSTNYTTN